MLVKWLAHLSKIWRSRDRFPGLAIFPFPSELVLRKISYMKCNKIQLKGGRNAKLRPWVAVQQVVVKRKLVVTEFFTKVEAFLLSDYW